MDTTVELDLPCDTAPVVAVLEEDSQVGFEIGLNLESAGYRVRMFHDARSARQYLLSNLVDLLVLSTTFGEGHDGLSFFHYLRESGVETAAILLLGADEQTKRCSSTTQHIRDFVSRNEAGIKNLPEIVGRALRQISLESHLATSEARLAGIVGSAMDAIIALNSNLEISLFNPAAERMFGVSTTKVVGKPLLDLIDASHRASLEANLNRVLSDVGGVTLVETAGARADGACFPLEGSVAKIVVGRRYGLTLVLRDVTDRKKAEEALRISEEKLRQSQKMEAIGKLAGGIAHDFNNLLTGINGYAQLLLATDLPAASKRDLAQIQELGNRAAGLTRQLLAFSRKQRLEPMNLNLNELLASTAKMLARLIGEQVDLRFLPCPQSLTVTVDPSQIEQVLINLAVNARDAMVHGGKLVIETNVIHLQESDRLSTSELQAGAYALLTVSDQGVGMSEELMGRIFEPFFTTKEVGRGTGLGLSTVYGIIRQHGGHISVSSVVGQGSTFRVYLPLSEKKELTRRRGAENDSGTMGAETVLLVEDEDSVRNIATRMLEQQGYHVLAARSASEAVTLYRRNQERIALLLSDVVLQDCSGRELYEALSAYRSPPTAVFISGYTDEFLVGRGLVEPGATILQKPFDAVTLCKHVRASLDNRDRATPTATSPAAAMPLVV